MDIFTSMNFFRAFSKMTVVACPDILALILARSDWGIWKNVRVHFELSITFRSHSSLACEVSAGAKLMVGGMVGLEELSAHRGGIGGRRVFSWVERSSSCFLSKVWSSFILAAIVEWASIWIATSTLT